MSNLGFMGKESKGDEHLPGKKGNVCPTSKEGTETFIFAELGAHSMAGPVFKVFAQEIKISQCRFGCTGLLFILVPGFLEGLCML